MKATWQWVAVAACVVAGVGRAESYKIVQITDMDREVTYQVATSAEEKELRKQLDAEDKVFQQAKAAAAKEWAADIVADHKSGAKTAKTLSFPSSAIRERMMSTLPRDYMKQDEAEKQVMKLEEGQSKRLEREIKNRATRKPDPGERDKDLALREAVTKVKAKMAELMKGEPGGAAGGKAVELPAAPKADAPKADAPKAAAPANAAVAAGGAVAK